MRIVLVDQTNNIHDVQMCISLNAANIAMRTDNHDLRQVKPLPSDVCDPSVPQLMKPYVRTKAQPIPCSSDRLRDAIRGNGG